MHEDSPPPFIVIRTPAPARRGVYERSLELVGLVHALVEHATARFHVKDRLDRATTGLVFELARAERAVKPTRWRHYRRAHELATDCATILDILLHQRAASASELEPARQLVRELLSALAALG